jgi:hypothetical protein
VKGDPEINKLREAADDHWASRTAGSNTMEFVEERPLFSIVRRKLTLTEGETWGLAYHPGFVAACGATIIMHYELLQFAGTLPRRFTVPTRPRIIIVIGVVLAAHILGAGLYAAAYYVLQTQFGMGGLGGISKGTCSTTSISRWPPTRRSISATCIQAA